MNEIFLRQQDTTELYFYFSTHHHSSSNCIMTSPLSEKLKKILTHHLLNLGLLNIIGKPNTPFTTKITKTNCLQKTRPMDELAKFKATVNREPLQKGFQTNPSRANQSNLFPQRFHF